MGSSYPKASVPLLLALQQSQHPVPRTFSLISSDGTCLPLCLLSLLIYFTGAHRAYANTLARFLIFFGIWTGRPVQSVQDCLCQALVDKAPLSGRASIVEAFLLWIADSVESPGAALIPPPRSFSVLTSRLASYLTTPNLSLYTQQLTPHVSRLAPRASLLDFVWLILLQTSFSTPACTSNTFCAGRQCCTASTLSLTRGRVAGAPNGSLPSLHIHTLLLTRSQAVL